MGNGSTFFRSKLSDRTHHPTYAQTSYQNRGHVGVPGRVKSESSATFRDTGLSVDTESGGTGVDVDWS